MERLDYMKLALDLAARAKGRTSPNPMVGAVIVKEDRIIGRGWHHRAGQPHAEQEALADATESPRGATMYVSLEPCCHSGKTPPCTKALIEAGLARVVYAAADPNPLVSGKGLAQLKAAGIEVEGPIMEKEARFLNRAFFYYVKEKKPFVTAKYAMSLDGKIATSGGQSQWITAPESRVFAHQLRDISDGVMIGSGTALTDNPRLTTRLEKGESHHPIRIILDSAGGVPLEARLFDPKLPGSTWVATTSAMGAAHRAALEKQGVEVLVLPANPDKMVSLEPLLNLLGERHMMSLMVEGGAEVMGSFFRLRLIQEIWCFMGAKLIGGFQAPGPIGGTGIRQLKSAPNLEIYETQRCGPDLLIKATTVVPDRLPETHPRAVKSKRQGETPRFPLA